MQLSVKLKTMNKDYFFYRLSSWLDNLLLNEKKDVRLFSSIFTFNCNPEVFGRHFPGYSYTCHLMMNIYLIELLIPNRY